MVPGQSSGLTVAQEEDPWPKPARDTAVELYLRMKPFWSQIPEDLEEGASSDPAQRTLPEGRPMLGLKFIKIPPTR